MMTSSNNENDNIPQIMIGPTEIKRVSKIKFLGVVCIQDTISSRLAYRLHLGQVCARVKVSCIQRCCY